MAMIRSSAGGVTLDYRLHNGTLYFDNDSDELSGREQYVDGSLYLGRDALTGYQQKIVSILIQLEKMEGICLSETS